MLIFKENTTLITPNRRLAADLHRRFNKAQSTKTWISPNILPYETWLEKTWEKHATKHYHEQPLILSTPQALHIWEDIITHSQQDHPLLNVPKTAKLAYQAYEHCIRWQVNINSSEFRYHENSEHFSTWAKRFDEICQQHGYTTLHTLADKLIEHTDYFTKTVHWVGFTEFSPQQKNLIDALKQRGIASYIETVNSNTTTQVFFSPQTDPHNEQIAMANWAKQQALAGKTVACIVPELEQIRENIETVFNKKCGQNINFNLSAGKPLGSYPIIYAALTFLRLNQHHIPIETISYILRSPFIKSDTPSDRARLASKLYSVNQTHFSLNELLFILKQAPTCSEFCTQLTRFLDIKKSIKKTTLENATTCFAKQLEALGWPGPRTLSSFEYQSLERWYQLLHEFSYFDITHKQTSLNTALKYLATFAEQTVFQYKSEENIQIHILGLLEAAGLEFDALWIMGMHDQAWPMPAKPNPFIPFDLQRQLAMPHADPQKELTFAKNLMDLLIYSHDNVTLSFAKQSGDQHFNASPLLADYHPKEITSEPVFSDSKDAITLETVTDVFPALKENEKNLRGTQLFKLQAQCPFRAFATLRLKAEPLDSLQPGITHIERGIVLHKALELFWQNTKTQACLKAYSENELNTLLDKHIDAAFEETFNKYQQQKKTPLLNLEKKRLKPLLFDWLTLEKTREAFEVKACEKTQTLSINGLTLSTRIDRLDKLADGSNWIIDYKTGKTSVTHWFGDRPTEPQLPLYCINNFDADAIVFAGLNKQDFGFKGIANEAHTFEEKPQLSIKPLTKLKYYTEHTQWQDQKQHWQKTLTQLAQDFQNGLANVYPKDSSTCQTCHLHTLCRIYEKENV